MKPKLIMASLAAIVLIFLLYASVLAMASPNFNLDWLVPMSGGGGGTSNSSSFSVDFTIGQSAVGPSSSANHKIGLGYWYGIEHQNRMFLPLVVSQ